MWAQILDTRICFDSLLKLARDRKFHIGSLVLIVEKYLAATVALTQFICSISAKLFLPPRKNQKWPNGGDLPPNALTTLKLSTAPSLPGPQPCE